MDVKPNWSNWEELPARRPDYHGGGAFHVWFVVGAVVVVLLVVPWLNRLRWLGDVYERYARWAAGQ